MVQRIFYFIWWCYRRLAYFNRR